MSKRYLSRSEFASRIGVKTSTLSRYDLPKPDVIIGPDTRPIFGWLPETVDEWQANRPGRGNWKTSR
ncbi:MAG: helix-turn-helix transcriptional regulator [Actinomyces sp.]|uniref:helix-turn-helix transcriptional regulator n=1 Tax=uncultured Actinomyces sp. TaxID=249061 RepID=UPI002805547A|nr:helix-turn-helix transcriptional regulator [uncultured Actinomyces sp.]MDU4831101.1 helix-turn-helix transcriptional regulator [Actinomyces sp.]